MKVELLMIAPLYGYVDIMESTTMAYTSIYNMLQWINNGEVKYEYSGISTSVIMYEYSYMKCLI